MTENAPGAYVALGDSISIDVYAGGPGRGGPSLLYKNRDDDFPEWTGRDLSSRHPGTEFLLLAADGATSQGVRYSQMPHLWERNPAVSLVTLTMGGNDLLQAYGSEAAADTAWRSLRANGVAVLGDLRRRLPSGTPIVVGTIYDPSDGTGDTQRLGLMSWPTALDWIAQFNDTLRMLAREYDTQVADIHDRFLGHGIRAGNPAQSDPRPANRDMWYCGVIEPNAWGASAVRHAFFDAIGTDR